MKIEKKIYEELLHIVPSSPPEVGGVLGGTEDVIQCFEIDYGIDVGRSCCYCPDVRRLNAIIKGWRGSNIKFFGIFHTHFFDVKTLSDGDLEYISKIMKDMPPQINKLYFPIVLPRKEIILYAAQRDGVEVRVFKETLDYYYGDEGA